MNELPLPGLKATEPIGFLAAVGLLRVLSGRPECDGAKLGWTSDGGSSAILFTHKLCEEDHLLAALLDHMRRRAEFAVFAGLKPDGTHIGNEPWKDVKVSPNSLTEMLKAVWTVASVHSREKADFYSALGSELVTLGNKDVIKPSALHMTSGNQAFLETARELARSLDPDGARHPKASCPPIEAFREAVFDYRNSEQTGWQAADQFSALGFDPAREAVYALTATAPTSTGPRSTRAAVWLAIEALPLFPVTRIRRWLHTRGFDLRTTSFRWPIWDGAWTVDAVHTGLGVPALYRSEKDPDKQAERIDKLRRLGIRAVMESERVTIGQGYGQLRPAVRVD